MNIASNEGFLKSGKYLVLTVMSAGHVLHVFVNGQSTGIRTWIIIKNAGFLSICVYLFVSGLLIGTVYGGLDNPKVTYTGNVKLRAGTNKISLLNVAVGLPVSVQLVLLSFIISSS